MLLNTKTDVKRSGMILLIVVAFLSMFLVVGTTYLLVADSIRRTSDFDLNATDKRSDFALMPDIDPRYMFNFALGQILYDVADPVISTTNSALRGHSLATSIYGSYLSGNLNNKAFSGTGKLNQDLIIAGSTIKEWQMVNYSFSNLFNPERLNGGTSTVKTSTWNAPYTYPDHNNFYLGWLKSDGTKVLPSFHRDYIFNSMAPPFAANPNWTNAIGKYLTPRPRPFDHAKDVSGNYLFPYPEADGLDVKNLEGYPGGNDSIWIDAGFPVMTTADGRKYKALIAPLILDLDGRINVNVAGNVMGAGGAHASNQGWGSWEINLSTALGSVTSPAIPEAQKVKIGDILNGSVLPGVYGLSKIPGGSTLPIVSASPWGTNAPTPHPYLTPTYSMIDFNAKSETGVNAPLSLSDSFASFPPFSGNYTSNVVTNEIGVDGSHPSFVNPQRIKIGNSKFNNNELASLLRWSGRSSSPFETTLVKILQTPLRADQIYDNSTMAIRNRITTLSADIQQSTLLPNSYTDISPIVGYMKQINLNRTLANYPKAYLVRDVGTWDLTANPPRPNGFKSFKTESDDLTSANGGRYVDDPVTGVAFGVTLAAATKDRQDFATEIFNGLKLATGVDPANADDNRYLAQLAANMVDYIDIDDVMTKFIWKYDVGGNPALDEYVFGVELPKVVINEVYSEIRNDPSEDDPNATPPVKPAEVPIVVAGVTKKTYPAKSNLNCKFWVELVNPLPADVSNANLALLEQDPYLVGGGPVRAPVYKIQILDGKDPALLAANNVEGVPSLPDKNIFKGFKPDESMYYDAATKMNLTPVNCKFDKIAFGTIGDYEKRVSRILHPVGTNYNGMQPINTADGQSGFLTIGPAAEFPSTDPATVMAPPQYNGAKFAYISNIRVPGLGYDDILVGGAAFNDTNITATISAKKHTVVLRRLANPYMKPEGNKALGDNYNPYVTVDFAEDVTLNDAVTYSNKDKRGANGTPAPPSTVPTLSDRKSFNKVQPYRSSITMIPSALQVALVGQPQHTFLRHNGSTVVAPVAPPIPVTDPMLQMPFKWLMHLDRKLINLLEILNVSGCKPQELTQKFSNPIYVDSNNKQIENKAPWLDESKKLYRFLALADVQGYQQGSAFAGRQIGKVNINNVWDKEVFNALCDANTNNNFTQAEVDTVFTNFLTGRSPTNLPAFGDNPIWGFGLGNSAGNDNWTGAPRGICNSFFRLNTLPLVGNAPTSVFDLPNKDNSTPPVEIRNGFQQKELLSKIYNNVTTKSNVFGVWITTGYFEVTDDTTQPPTLGAEIGKADGINIRHRMFAIVDRTNMTSFETTYPNAITITPPATSITVPYAGVGTGTNPNTKANWSIQAAVAPNLPVTPGSPGTILVFEPNTDFEETVEVQVGGNVTFTKNHPAGCKVINRGNPGPWVGYDRTKDRDVVPYAEIIE